MNATRRAFLQGSAVALGTMALGACGANKGSKGSGAESGSAGVPNGQGKTLSVLIAANTTYPTQQKAWFQQVSDRFEAKTGAKVSFDTFASSNDEMQKLQTAVAASQGPDLYDLGTTFTPLAASTGAFVTLGSKQWAQVGGKDRFPSSTLGMSGKDDSHEVAVPLMTRPFVMAYNTDMFKAANLQPPTSWDEFRTTAKALTRDGNYGAAIAYNDSYDPWKYIWMMAIQAGNPLVVGNKAKLTDPTVVTAYSTYFGWLTDDKVVDPAAIGWSNTQALANFAQGKAAMFPMTTGTSYPTLEKSAIASKFAYALLPTIPPNMKARPADGKEAASILSGDNIVVASYSKNRDLAFTLIEMLTEKDAQLSYQKTFGDFPSNAKALGELASSTPAYAPITKAATMSVATPFVGAWSEIQLALTGIVTQSLPNLKNGTIGSDDLHKLLESAQAKAQSALDRQK